MYQELKDKIMHIYVSEVSADYEASYKLGHEPFERVNLLRGQVLTEEELKSVVVAKGSIQITKNHTEESFIVAEPTPPAK